MGYQVLARKYRPQRFADVAGQDHVTRTLLNALSQNRIAHGYIFSGHRGIGKTTIARILAQALNCRTEIGSPQRPTPEPCGVCDSCVEIRQGNAVDVIEIDAATNRGIDEIRELREAARYSPARDRYKIYILDEAHQITEAAFNALLKTLEEPPAHVIFMMATTEPENIPQTIRSRCQHFSFHAVKFDDILAQLKAIAAQESVDAEDAALALLAEAGDGSMRDALSIMDQAIASAPMENGRPALAATQIRELMGSVPNAVFERLLEAVAAGQSVELMEQLNVLLNAGHSPSSLARQMVRYLRNTLMARIGGEQTELLQISADERARAARTALLFGEEELTRNLQIVLRTFDDLNYRQEQRFHLELGLLKLIHAQRLLPIEELLSGAAGSGGARSGTAPSTPAPRSAPTAPRASAAPFPTARPTPQPAAQPSISPFGAGTGAWAPAPVAASTAPVALAEAGSSAAVPVEIEIAPHAAGSNGANMMNGATHPVQEAADSDDLAVSGTAAEVPAPAESSAATTPESAPGESADTAMLSAAVVTALAAAGHGSAGQLLGSGAWIIDGGNLRIEVALMSKKMLALTVNAAAEKIIKQELQRLGGPGRFLVVPGAGGGTGSAISAATMAAPITGSIEQEALAHPLVQRARDIFHAEVRSVVDLRQK
ncbi:MAG TPA: DNA polymerase III subunit gamma/tau [Terracidiphilus sp.]|nr:DNA polymerase III subunit gamma/tau [Terracidiphilus sp.]